ncbi:MAG TPA: ribbon-helix-helix domain-containing protein [Thermoanaerobaculia bacterium]|nr:ribbon-helix-helix domain-containing protein [Thermoanaerobaculia bacterium]
MKPISLHVDEDVYRDLRSLAERAGRPVAEVIREAMSEYLTRRQGNGVSIFELLPHPSGAQLRGWRREELLDEMRLATVDSGIE